jgi:DNA-binding NtrC family response regulator
MNKVTGKILAIDDNESILLTLKQSLKYEVREIECIKNPNLIPQKLEQKEWDVVLLDMNFSAGINSGNEGIYWLREIKRISPDTLVILLTAYGDIQLAVQGMKEGAHDFVSKPWDIDKLLATIKSAVRLRESERKVNALEQKQAYLVQQNQKTEYHFLGSSTKMNEIFKTIHKVGPTDANILVYGENGTGKELLAREIHRVSNRKDKLFVGVDLGAINENLFESEMFGHKKGAFTDAQTDRIGRIEAANGGSLFLDEIGNLPLNLQAKLLRVLQNREIQPLGSEKTIKVDIRLISATNINPEELVSRQLFREDLLYRINTITIEMPPLREREDDIMQIALHYLKVFAKKYDKNKLRISKEGMDALYYHNWPGNIRELKHCMEKAVILSENAVLGPEDFRIGKANSETPTESNKLSEVEKFTVKKVLDKHRGNLTKAAKELGISRTTLYLKIEKHEL